jgi:hypothetical protein
MKDMERAKLVSKRMKQALEPFEPYVKLSKCQALVAKLYGYADWHEMREAHGLETPSLDDSLISQTQFAERRTVFVQRLVDCGIDASIARYLVVVLHPTAEKPIEHQTQKSYLNDLSTLLHPFKADFFWLGCEGSTLGHLSFRQGGKRHTFPFRRPDLAVGARALFSFEAGYHPAARTEVEGEFPVMAWRTQWNGRDMGVDMPAMFVGVALFRRQAGWPDDVPDDYWGRKATA